MAEEQLFNPDPTKIQVALALFEKGEYVFTIGEPKAFARDKKDKAGNITGRSVGVRYPIVCNLPATHDGLRQFFSAYIHTDGALAFAKGFVMAALGFNPRDQKSEESFNAKYAGVSWSVDVGTGAVGDMWRNCKGHQIKLSCDITIQEDGSQGQQFNNPQPVTI